jgi:hypothetical protein
VPPGQLVQLEVGTVGEDESLLEKKMFPKTRFIRVLPQREQDNFSILAPAG